MTSNSAERNGGASLFLTTLARVRLPTTSAPSFRASIRRTSSRIEAAGSCRPCHERAIHSSPDRFSGDNHGQRYGGLDLPRSVSAHVTRLPDLALGAGGRAGSNPAVRPPA